MSGRTKVIVGVVVVVAVFLLGYVPQVLKVWRLEAELESTQAELADYERRAGVDELGSIASEMLLAAMDQNYGIAQALSTEYFDNVAELEVAAENPSLKGRLSMLLSQRDAITAALTQGSATVVPELQALLRSTNDLPE